MQTCVFKSVQGLALRFLLLAGMAVSLAFAASAVETPCLIPAPQQMKLTGGECVLRGAVKEERVAGLPREGYELSITPKGVTVRFSDAAGAFYARKTLFHMGRAARGGGTVYPCLEIRDFPRYRWRGFMIDDCRHFFGKEAVKRIIDEMSWFKFNVMHWHLTDDQGWRLDIPGAPEIVREGSVRSASVRHGSRHELNGEKYGPYFYTEQDVREILAYAAERHIKVVPEIEFPGHFRAVLASHPEFACEPDRVKGKGPRTAWGIAADVLCIGNDAALAFVEKTLDYVCRLFPSDVIHIGGDECPQRRWKTCAKCQARIRAEGLKGVGDLQPWITRRMVAFLEKRGKRVLGWDEYLLGDVPASAIGMRWRVGRGGAGHKCRTPREWIERGHDMVMTPSSHCYFDYAQGLDGDPFQYIGGRVTLERVYSFDPSEGIPENLRGKVLGGQCNNWAEYTWGLADLEWKLWPRTFALAEALWTAPAKRDFAAFEARAQEQRRRFLRSQINCAPVK